MARTTPVPSNAAMMSRRFKDSLLSSGRPAGRRVVHPERSLPDSSALSRGTVAPATDSAPSESGRRWGVGDSGAMSDEHSGRRKLVVFVPADALDAVREALFAAGAGRIGEYERCSWYAEGTGTFL